MAGMFLEKTRAILRAPIHPELARDEEGNTRLTHDYVVALCEFNGQYTTPKANSQLYLHFKGK